MQALWNTYVLRFAESREEGQGLVEYALIIVFVALVAIAGLTLLGGNINTMFNTLAGQI
jgi:pilus assembly protein Flp/PilA